MQLKKSAQVIANEQAKTEEYQHKNVILEQQNKRLQEEVLEDKNDKQREAAATLVKINDGKGQREVLDQQILRLRAELARLRDEVDLSKNTRTELEDLKRKIARESAEHPDIIGKLGLAGLKYNSNIKF